MYKSESVSEVFFAFLKLGLTSFGGPIAHIGYYRKAFVEQRRWLNEEQFAQLLALCQFLPGPASSQMGFSLGLMRAGWLGALAAFLAFTLPSALLLFAFAQVLPYLSDSLGNALVHGLKLVALVVVAQAVWQMAIKLTPDWTRRIIAVSAMIFLLLFAHPLAQIIVVIASAVLGLMLCHDASPKSTAISVHYGSKLAWPLLTLFFILLFSLPWLASSSSLFAVADAFYRAGALVFGGGHVVLPLLEHTVVEPGWVAADEYLAGYGAAQAVPGPVFSVAAYLGAMLPGDNGGLAGAVLALMAIFLPGFLLVSAMLPLWQKLHDYPMAASAIAGVNAGVVGLLAAALYDPIWISVVYQLSDVIIAVAGLLILQLWRVSALWVVLWCIGASVILSLL